MKRTGRFLFAIIRILIVSLLVMTILLFGRNLWNAGIMGEIRTQSAVLKQNLESSKRLEVTSIDEEGILEAKTSVILLGTVGSTTIRYLYTASVGVDLGKVTMTTDTDRIVFSLPDPEILNDGIEALEVSRHDFFSKAIDKSVETLLYEQRVKCREQYLNEQSHSDKIWDDTVKAFDETICSWLEQYGQRHYQFVYERMNQSPAV